MMAPLLVILLAVAPPEPPRIAAAANLTSVLDDLLALCQVAARPTYGATGSLAAQIEQGAPFDLLLAADAATPEKLEEKHVGIGHSFAYARGKLALWVPVDSTLEIEKQGVQALRDPSVKRIAIANPKLAPYGKLAQEKLREAGLDDPQKLVLGESVSQAAQFAQSGNVQAAMLPLSLAMGMPKGRYVEIAGAAIEQRGLLLRESAPARKLVDCMLGPEARAVLEKRGYAPP
jgi:molybdate transport system substrate-binding protein